MPENALLVSNNSRLVTNCNSPFEEFSSTLNGVFVGCGRTANTEVTQILGQFRSQGRVGDDPEASEKTSGAVGRLRELRRKGMLRLEQFLLIVSGIANEMKFREYGPPEADSFALGPLHV
jgi:hypothetical protein